MSHSTYPTIILGGGFTGLFTALHLSHLHYSQQVILIDQHERFSFNPLLYEFLSGEMKDYQVWPRYEELLDGSGVKFVQDKVEAIDLEQRQVKLSGGSYTYSHLVLALGTTTSYFGVEGAYEHSLPFRNGEHVVALAKHLRYCLQRAIERPDLEERRTLTTVAIVGAGPTGVELATTLADLLPNWYSGWGGNPQEIRVVIMDQKTDILSSQGNDKSSVKDTAQKALSQRNVPVELLLGAKACAVRADQLEFQRSSGQSETLPTATVIWTAGTTALPLIQELPIPEEHRDRQGRLHITSTLQLLDFPFVFAGGDCAAYVADPLPPTAQVAYQQGRAIAHNLKALKDGNSLSPAKVNFRGTLLKLGLGESSANIFDSFEIKGKLGHLIRQATYLGLLPTPMHNFKVTTGWLVDEIFHRYNNPANLASPIANSRD